ncbi:2-oxo acid dehydrogenase subunit E2 [Croceicoccus ponticola]|uniref:Dihydrolipoamide acetyltransferase component of pyruvate dehydrogenase complex n=1 Tax=Croceicoccus ponticola TaxID=2217664 RepID=A0A437H1W4_9SPHN|nr:2-oxo acid dehydrogenase subunit E2 [Croceicoccus ponticola]
MGLFAMPSLGAGMEAGTLVEWLRKPGDAIAHGDIIAVVETEKGAIEVEVFETGILEKLLVEPGSKVPVGTPLASIRAEGEAAVVTPVVAVDAGPVAVEAPPLTVEAPPVAAPEHVPPPPSAVPLASPAARKLAQERGIDLSALTGTGAGGAIVVSDVEGHADVQGPTDVEGQAAKPAASAAADLGPMRRAIAAAMARSKREIPHYYLSHSMDMSAATAWLNAYNAQRLPEQRLLMGALQLKAVALALLDYGEFNGFYEDGKFQPSSSIHTGLAISIRGGGLAAPAIHDVDKLPLARLMTQMRELVGRVRNGRFHSSEISDPTVTVSNLGDRGVEALLPVIYPPQVAIIGFGAALPRPWAVGDALAVRPIVQVSLAGDHRANDGHRGALLLLRIDKLMQEPGVL